MTRSNATPTPRSDPLGIAADHGGFELKQFLFGMLSEAGYRATDFGDRKRRPKDGAPIDGLKVITESGWFAARPSGTEDIYKIYAESFCDDTHLRNILEEAQAIVSAALTATTAPKAALAPRSPHQRKAGDVVVA